MSNTHSQIRSVLKIVIIALLIAFAVTTFMDLSPAYDVISPILTVSMAVLVYISLSTTGKYNRVGICFFLAICVWVLGDILWAYNSVSGNENAIIDDIADNFYLVSDYVFLMGTIVYARDIFKKSEYQRMAVNGFIVSVVCSIVGYRFAMNYHKFDGRISIELVELMLYFFVSVFSIMVEGMVISKTGIRGHNKAFYMILISMFVFNVMEIRYTYMMIINKDPESIYIDILYLACLMVYSFAWTRTDIEGWVITPIEKVHKKDKYIPWVNAGLILLLTIIFCVVKYFDSNMLFGMIITALAYLIMCQTVQANALAEELLARQKDETIRLEKMVEEKIKELKQVNENLEYISNTDVLTGLYNRRYGLSYLEDLVKDGDNYPIALYSLDLNYFKPINDNYGHDMGDAVLREVGKRLHNLGQQRCTAVRIGGDEFLVVFKNATNEVAIRGIADLICKAMDEPIEATIKTEDGETKSHSFQISASIGIAGIPRDTETIDELYKMADDALYTVKHTSEKSSYLLYSEIEEFKKKLENNSTEEEQ